MASVIIEVAIGALVVLSIVGTLIALAQKGYFEPDSTNEATQEEREELQESVGSEDFRIPYRRRVKSWSTPYKVFVGSLVLLTLGAGVATYQVMKTGSPAQQFVTSEVRLGLVAIVGIGGGVWLKSWFDSQVGYLDVVYERAGQQNILERIPYARTRVRRRNGEETVPEIADNRLLGLFWRYRQVGEDRRLRGKDKPLDDVITHKVPPHGEERPDGDGFVVTTTKEGDQILEGSSTADVTYSSPNNLSRERSIQIKEQRRRKDAELRAVKATNAELTQQVRKMRKKIENEEYKDRTELLDDFDRFSEQLNAFKVRLQDESKNDAGPESNGTGDEAKA